MFGRALMGAMVRWCVGASVAASCLVAKHALVGLMRVLAIELGPNSIRVNCVHPT
jgi:(+)-trans-carveol dehydrogenase